jgi:hypothetical protein
MKDQYIPESPDWDDCYSICTDDGEDCVYIGVESDGNKWWAFVSTYCDTGSFCCDYGDPVGPLEHYTDAVQYGIWCAAQWFSDNGCHPDTWDEQVSAVLDAAGMDEAFVRREVK